jgi:hypothetical protein
VNTPPRGQSAQQQLPAQSNGAPPLQKLQLLK